MPVGFLRVRTVRCMTILLQHTILGQPRPLPRNRHAGKSSFLPKWARDEQARLLAACKDVLPETPFDGYLVLDVWFFRQDAHSCDTDNLVKMFQDALSKNLWADDRLILDPLGHQRIDRKNPRIEFTLTAFEGPRDVTPPD